MDNIIMRVAFGKRRMYLSRFTIKNLGNPTHLHFWFDDHEGNIFVTAADKDDLDAYQIQDNFWKTTKRSCEISRFPFLLALQYRIGWENDGVYLYNGIIGESNGKPAAVFNLIDGTHLEKEVAANGENEI